MTGRVVVVGDTLLDRDVDGVVTRLCPDAPVPVLDQSTSVDRPGGAGLAALLAARHGIEIVLVTALADDAGGARLSELLTAAGVQLYALPLPGTTPEKIRLRARGQVLLRLDRGGAGGAPGEPSDEALDVLADAAAILVSDYGRGVARQPALRAVLAASSAPVVWDPHPRGPAAVPGVRLATPNEAEVRELAGETSGPSRLVTASRGAQGLRQRWQAGAVAVTLGGDGALLCHAGATPLVVPAPAKADGDTCGAGDQFAASATVALAHGALVSEAVQEAVARASAYVADGGAGFALDADVPADLPAWQRQTPTTIHTRSRVAASGPAAAYPATPTTAATPTYPTTAATSTTAAATYPATAATATYPATAAHGHGGASRPGEGPERIGPQAAGALVAEVRAAAGTVVATGGCFDLLHAGHVATLQAARRLGDCLVVCLNSDESVAAIKGPDRPVVPQADRCRLLAALGCVDAVLIFDEPTPHAVLSWLRPDVWVKGGDYGTGGGDEPDLPEAEIVRRWGGYTVVVPYLDGHSTTGMIAAARSGGGHRMRGVR